MPAFLGTQQVETIAGRRQAIRDIGRVMIDADDGTKRIGIWGDSLLNGYSTSNMCVSAIVAEFAARYGNCPEGAYVPTNWSQSNPSFGHCGHNNVNTSITALNTPATAVLPNNYNANGSFPYPWKTVPNSGGNGMFATIGPRMEAAASDLKHIGSTYLWDRTTAMRWRIGVVDNALTSNLDWTWYSKPDHVGSVSGATSRGTGTIACAADMTGTYTVRPYSTTDCAWFDTFGMLRMNSANANGVEIAWALPYNPYNTRGIGTHFFCRGGDTMLSYIGAYDLCGPAVRAIGTYDIVVCEFGWNDAIGSSITPAQMQANARTWRTWIRAQTQQKDLRIVWWLNCPHNSTNATLQGYLNEYAGALLEVANESPNAEIVINTRRTLENRGWSRALQYPNTFTDGGTWGVGTVYAANTRVYWGGKHWVTDRGAAAGIEPGVTTGTAGTWRRLYVFLVGDAHLMAEGQEMMGAAFADALYSTREYARNYRAPTGVPSRLERLGVP